MPNKLMKINVEMIPKNQLKFRTESWLKKERIVSGDLKKGKVKSYKNKEAFLKAMRKW